MAGLNNVTLSAYSTHLKYPSSKSDNSFPTSIALTGFPCRSLPTPTHARQAPRRAQTIGVLLTLCFLISNKTRQDNNPLANSTLPTPQLGKYRSHTVSKSTQVNSTQSPKAISTPTSQTTGSK
ncbi:uncharacterized protein RAG0_15532 [Rhynchosporium agropyri]|uniref:Uncharacterized protein n=1 Tax=Rhynchosporium agropyri TaxID=914238 RepID=A0A1E1LLK8_9HELO|nr:uncharacterized protein RAG0_15532 [Rhynchosporium agropyri]